MRNVAAGEPIRQAWLPPRLRALRAFSFPLSALPVIVAAAAARTPSAWRWDALAAATLAAVLFHAAGNLANDYFDFLSGVDRRRDDDPRRPGRQLIRGELAPIAIIHMSGVFLGLALLPAAYLVWKCGIALLPFMAAAVIGLYAYTGPPFNLKYRALGEPLIFLVFGPILMLAAAWTQTGAYEIRALWLSLPVGMATTAILVANNLRDQQEDGEAGIRTLVHVIGPNAAGWLYAGLIIGAPLVAAALGIAGIAPKTLIALPLLLILCRRPLAAVIHRRRLPHIDVLTARFATIILLALAVALIADGMN